MSTLIGKTLKIIWHDRKTGPFRIVAKSYARYRRFGFKDMRRKLEREYFALYPGENRAKDEERRYRQWRKRKERNIFRKAMPIDGPIFTVLTAVEKAPLSYLRSMVHSLRQQTYGRWELRIVLPKDPTGECGEFLDRITRRDSRIRLERVEEGESVAALFRRILSETEGRYILQLGEEDRLAPHALLECAKILQRKPKVRLIYSDEDRIDEKGQRYAPFFKPDWNPDLFDSFPYLGSLCCLEKSLLEEVDAWAEGYGDAAQYRFLLRAVHRLLPFEIHHIPQILYHRRVRRNEPRIFPISLDSTEAVDAVRDALKEPKVNVLPGLLEGSVKVEHPLPDPPPKVSIIIPTRDRYDLLHRCIESILEKTHYPNYEILIVDNQSSDPKTLEYFEKLQKEYAQIRVLPYDRPFNYSAINNEAVRHASGEVVALVNNDVEIISHHWLTEMVRHAIRPEIGAVGAMLYYDNLTVQHAGVVLGLGEVAGHGHKYFPRESPGHFGRLKVVQNYSAVTGACLVVRKKLYEEVGGLEETHLTVAFNDVDFCLKLREKGYRNLWTPYAELFHHESKSRGVDNTPEKQKRFEEEVRYMQRRWGRLLERDPCYSRHLSRFFEDFRIEVYWEQRKRLYKKLRTERASS